MHREVLEGLVRDPRRPVGSGWWPPAIRVPSSGLLCPGPILALGCVVRARPHARQFRVFVPGPGPKWRSGPPPDPRLRPLETASDPAPVLLDLGAPTCGPAAEFIAPRRLRDAELSVRIESDPLGWGKAELGPAVTSTLIRQGWRARRPMKVLFESGRCRPAPKTIARLPQSRGGLLPEAIPVVALRGGHHLRPPWTCRRSRLARRKPDRSRWTMARAERGALLLRLCPARSRSTREGRGTRQRQNFSRFRADENWPEDAVIGWRTRAA